MVTVPVDVMEAAVMEPVESTTNAPLATDIVPVVPMLMFDARSVPAIVPSTMELLLTESAPTDDEEMPVSPEPFPTNPVAVTVPTTTSFVDGVMVPMPTFPPALRYS